MNIQLKPEDEQFIQIQIARGKYENPSEVISKALKLLGLTQLAQSAAGGFAPAAR